MWDELKQAFGGRSFRPGKCSMSRGRLTACMPRRGRRVCVLLLPVPMLSCTGGSASAPLGAAGDDERPEGSAPQSSTSRSGTPNRSAVGEGAPGCVMRSTT